jgi:hypothetical protein
MITDLAKTNYLMFRYNNVSIKAFEHKQMMENIMDARPKPIFTNIPN